jgi:hypothetical protein
MIILVPIIISPKLPRIKKIQQAYDPNGPSLRPVRLNSPSISNQTERNAVYFSIIGFSSSESMKLKQLANAVIMIKSIKRKTLISLKVSTMSLTK